MTIKIHSGVEFIWKALQNEEVTIEQVSLPDHRYLAENYNKSDKETREAIEGLVNANLDRVMAHDKIDDKHYVVACHPPQILNANHAKTWMEGLLDGLKEDWFYNFMEESALPPQTPVEQLLTKKEVQELFSFDELIKCLSDHENRDEWYKWFGQSEEFKAVDLLSFSDNYKLKTEDGKILVVIDKDDFLVSAYEHTSRPLLRMFGFPRETKLGFYEENSTILFKDDSVFEKFVEMHHKIETCRQKLIWNNRNKDNIRVMNIPKIKLVNNGEIEYEYARHSQLHKTSIDITVDVKMDGDLDEMKAVKGFKFDYAYQRRYMMKHFREGEMFIDRTIRKNSGEIVILADSQKEADVIAKNVRKRYLDEQKSIKEDVIRKFKNEFQNKYGHILANLDAEIEYSGAKNHYDNWFAIVELTFKFKDGFECEVFIQSSQIDSYRTKTLLEEGHHFSEVADAHKVWQIENNA